MKNLLKISLFTISILSATIYSQTECQAWLNSIAYSIDDRVEYNGKYYVAIKEVYQNTPPTDTWFWTEISDCDGIIDDPTSSNSHVSGDLTVDGNISGNGNLNIVDGNQIKVTGMYSSIEIDNGTIDISAGLASQTTKISGGTINASSEITAPVLKSSNNETFNSASLNDGKLNVSNKGGSSVIHGSILTLTGTSSQAGSSTHSNSKLSFSNSVGNSEMTSSELSLSNINRSSTLTASKISNTDSETFNTAALTNGTLSVSNKAGFTTVNANTINIGAAYSPNTSTLSNSQLALKGQTSETIINSNSVATKTVQADAIYIKNWSIEVPDYVFSDEYNLRSLEDVECYINQESHLPGVPSAKEISKGNVDLIQINMKLLEKIEELTLYTIEQEKRIKNLENR